MRTKLIAAVAFVALSFAAGATIFRDTVAHAAQLVSADITGPLDQQGNVKVHEQGTANVNVTNSGLPVHETGTPHVKVDGTVHTDSTEQTAVVYSSSFCGRGAPTHTRADAPIDIPVDTNFSSIRIQFNGGSDLQLVVHNGDQNGPVLDEFTTPASGRVTRVYDVPPPSVTVACNEDVAQFFEPGTLEIYGWR